MRNQKGIELLDILIVILIVAVIGAILLPKINADKNKKIVNNCRTNIKAIGEAEFKYYKENWRKNIPIPDTTSTTSKKKTKSTELDTINVVRVFTDDYTKLTEYLPAWSETLKISPKCPLDGRDYIFTVRDSLFFSITCPNGHGESVKSILTWEKK